jgi:hypothetical protein
MVFTYTVEVAITAFIPYVAAPCEATNIDRVLKDWSGHWYTADRSPSCALCP